MYKAFIPVYLKWTNVEKSILRKDHSEPNWSKAVWTLENSGVITKIGVSEEYFVVKDLIPSGIKCETIC